MNPIYRVGKVVVDVRSVDLISDLELEIVGGVQSWLFWIFLKGGNKYQVILNAKDNTISYATADAVRESFIEYVTKYHQVENICARHPV